MHLNFLGAGGRFNTALGNTSAYYIEDGKLLLINCGETTFGKIKELNLLDNISAVFFVCTYTRSDLVGSLGTLCLYCHYRNIDFYVAESPSYIIRDYLFQLLSIFNCSGLSRSFEIGMLSKYFHEIKEAEYIRTWHHVDVLNSYLPAYLIHFHTKDGHILYSGDTTNIEQIESWVEDYYWLGIAHMYLEANESSETKNIYLSLSDLDRIVPPELRDKCTLMHFDNQKCIEHAKDLGFRIASP